MVSVSGWSAQDIDEIVRAQAVNVQKTRNRQILRAGDDAPSGFASKLQSDRSYATYSSFNSDRNVPRDPRRGRTASYAVPGPRGTFIRSVRIDDPESGAIFIRSKGRREASPPVHLVDYGNGVFSRPMDVVVPGTSIARNGPAPPPPSTDIVGRAIADLQALPARLGVSMPTIQDIPSAVATIGVLGGLAGLAVAFGLALAGAGSR